MPSHDSSFHEEGARKRRANSISELRFGFTPIAIHLAASLVALFTFVARAQAQDAQYWGVQYGTRSALMGGAVVGGVRDTSALFYNPGALAMIENQTISVSANAYRFDTANLEDGAGDGNDLDSTEVTVYPSLISGLIEIDDSHTHAIGYGVLTRLRTSISAGERKDARIDVLSNPYNPGPEDFTGQVDYDQDITELWGGIGYAYRPTSWISLGATNFLALRTEEASESVRARAVNVNALEQPLFSSAAVDSSTAFEYTDLRLLWKLGVALDFGELKLGVTATTPSVNVYGRGEVSGDLSVLNVDADGDGVPQSIIANDKQSSIQAEYHSPPSVAVGGEYTFAQRTTVGVAYEWFGGVGDYGVLRPESRQFVRPIGTFPEFDTAEAFQVHDGADAISNVAVGIEHAFTPKHLGYLSFRTDFETRQNERAGITRAISNWDIYHFTVGGMYRRTRSDVSLGIEYSYGGTDDRAQVVNLSNPAESNLLQGEIGEASVNYRSLAIFLGYTYHFE